MKLFCKNFFRPYTFAANAIFKSVLSFPHIQLTRHNIFLASWAKQVISTVHRTFRIKAQRPSAVFNLTPLTLDALSAANPCTLHQALLCSFFFLFCHFQKTQCILPFWVKQSFSLLILSMPNFFRKDKFLREN